MIQSISGIRLSLAGAGLTCVLWLYATLGILLQGRLRGEGQMQSRTRCGWCGDAADYQHYHDVVWGVPVYNSQELFAKLCLDGQQAGLSWITILRKSDEYQRVFKYFDPEFCAALSDDDLDVLMQNPGIVRNRLKLRSIRQNAQAYLNMLSQGEDFSEFLWAFMPNQKPLINQFESMADLPASTPLSEEISKALKKRGFNFVGPTIVYAFMQAVGMVDDHLTTCWRRSRSN